MASSQMTRYRKMIGAGYLYWCIRTSEKKSYIKFCEMLVTDKTNNLEALMRQAMNGSKLAYASLLKETFRFLCLFLAKRLCFSNE
jgi:hypothetical protein